MIFKTEKIVLTEETSSKSDLKAIRLKAEAVNRTIENLLNKKIRIDLEIKKQKTVLQNLKKQSSLKLKTSLRLENLIESKMPLTSEELEQLEGSTDPALLQEAKALDQELDHCIELLQKIEELNIS